MSDTRIILLPYPRALRRTPGVSAAPVEEKIDPSIRGHCLSITPQSCRIVARDPANALYARQTLAQLRRQFPAALPCLEIEDWPDFAVRGVMLDISRDKVTTMRTLFDLVDMLSEWKINQLQLYIEHTFAYAGHEDVWQNASPMTADELRELDRYCRERFIELVPNQNSFGHMERWLKHPRYLALAEAPDGAETPWGFRWKGPFGLCPTDPKSLELLGDLYSQFLPNFTSRQFNVGCDETFDIGQGRSKAECERRGVHRVYLDFLHKVNQLVIRHDRQMMFWGDIIVKEPELIPELPTGVIALNWGYEADHPFDAEARRFAESGIPFYVCPGTSSWCSIGGRTDNMLANQISAAEAGLKNGAVGYLNTDWGDYGHLQYLPISYPGFAAGAAMSWCLEANRNLSLQSAFGQLAIDLGNVYKSVGKLIANRSALFSIIVPSSIHSDPMAGITREGLDAAQSAIDAAMRNPQSKDDLVKSEFENAAAMLRFACRKGRWLLDPTSENESRLTDEVNEIIARHRTCWLARNRPGGLEDSVARLDPSSPLNRQLAIGNRQS
jgi:hexosaminidase